MSGVNHVLLLPPREEEKAMKNIALLLSFFCILVLGVSLAAAVPLPTGISGFVYEGDTSNRVQGVTVVINGSSNVTDSNGSYAFQLPSGLYDISYSKLPEYYTESLQDIPVVSGYNIVNFGMTKKPTGNITGTVTLQCPQNPSYTETISAGVYSWNMSYVQNCNGSVVILNTITDVNFTDADVFGNYTFNTSNPSANISNVTTSSFVINASVTSGETNWYSFTQNYNNNASVSVADQWLPLRLNVSVEFTAYDADNNILSISGKLNNTTLSSPSPHDFGNLSPAVYSYSLNVSENATTGPIIYNRSATITKADFDGVEISFFDTIDGMYNLDGMYNSDTEFHVYSANGEFETAITSNGSYYIFDYGGHIVQVLPANGGYGDNPIQFLDIVLYALPVVFGIILVLTAVLALWLLGQKIAEVRT